MSHKYLCPKCRSYLMVDDKVVIAAKAQDGSEGLISLSSKLGDYTVRLPKTLKQKKGDLLTLFCPVCHENLSSGKHVNLAMVLAVDESRQEFEILFSQVIGEQSTLKMMGDHIELFGNDVYKYQGYFKPRQMF